MSNMRVSGPGQMRSRCRWQLAKQPVAQHWRRRLTQERGGFCFPASFLQKSPSHLAAVISGDPNLDAEAPRLPITVQLR